MSTTYPITITQARYQGVYEGGAWLAFNADASEIDRKFPDWDGGDTECCSFWCSPEADLIGRGGSPNQAVESLLRRLQAQS